MSAAKGWLRRVRSVADSVAVTVRSGSAARRAYRLGYNQGWRQGREAERRLGRIRQDSHR